MSNLKKEIQIALEELRNPDGNPPSTYGVVDENSLIEEYGSLYELNTHVYTLRNKTLSFLRECGINTTLSKDYIYTFLSHRLESKTILLLYEEGDEEYFYSKSVYESELSIEEYIHLAIWKYTNSEPLFGLKSYENFLKLLRSSHMPPYVSGNVKYHIIPNKNDKIPFLLLQEWKGVKFIHDTSMENLLDLPNYVTSVLEVYYNTNHIEKALYEFIKDIVRRNPFNEYPIPSFWKNIPIEDSYERTTASFEEVVKKGFSYEADAHKKVAKYTLQQLEAGSLVCEGFTFSGSLCSYLIGKERDDKAREFFSFLKEKV